MPSGRVQAKIDALLDEVERAIDDRDWERVQDTVRQVLRLDPKNADALDYLAAAGREPAELPLLRRAMPAAPPAAQVSEHLASIPIAFASGRYEVKRFLGEGGKKRVYLAHDTLLDRDVAFALIKTEGLDDTARERIAREAQAMGRLGAHPHIVTVFDLGDEASQPYMVTELMGGGDVEGAIEHAPEHKLPLAEGLAIAEQVCQGLEFAHGKGIVHRDLKPGNVWLTADGVAKIGDFGLAVAIDRTRLTQAGMMVGTVSYMPPEQAMGGEVTPRSDLYSLGAMLYEMVTGRPPFVGDESVAIIGQHLNTAPVSPSWHNHLTPPALETLILRLLEKNPSKRSASAADVLQTLKAIQRSKSGPDADSGLSAVLANADAAAENPMYRRTFVGREAELHQLQAAYDAALSGQGGLVMVVGEPGIGKTSLTEQLATYATIRGGRSLVGHCYEEGSLSLPYLPFVEAMRSYVLAREPEGLKSDLGSGAADVARIVSEIRDRFPVELREAADPDDDRWRLLQGVSGFLRNASTVQPLLIVLEDLHDADRGTLDLLTHLARNLLGARLLLVGTYRDVEVDRAHPLSSTLAELRRGQNFLRVPLRGLSVDEVARMMSAIHGQDVPWSRAEAVHRQTEGNPLFIQEVLRYLVEEGLVVREGGRYVRTDGSDPASGIPEGLRDVIGKRLSRLSAATNQVLSVAAVVGRDFRLDVLQQVAGLPEEELDVALEEASSRSLIEQRPSLGSLAFRFTHAFFRQMLYDEIFASRRLRLHQQVARALETVYGRRVEEHAAELAEHYAQSTDAVDLERALRYSELAAQRATSVFAYGEAARHLEQALKVQEVLDPDDQEKRCDLLSLLAEALIPAGEPQRVRDDVAPAALKSAEALGDHARAARVAGIGMNAHVASIGSSPSLAEGRKWAQLADRYAAPNTSMRVRADIALAGIAQATGRADEPRALYAKALELARRVADPEMLFYAAATSLGWSTEEATQDLALADEFTAHSREGVHTRTIAYLLNACARTYLSWGRRERAEELWQEVIELSSRARDPLNALRPHVIASVLATIDGRFDDALESAAQLRVRAEEAGLTARAENNANFLALGPLLLLGRGKEAVVAWGTLGLIGPGWFGELNVSARQALWLASIGRPDEAREMLGPFVASLRSGTGGEELGVPALACLLEAAIQLRDRDLAALLAPRLTSASSFVVIGSSPAVIARHLGAASALLGDREAARAYYEQALEVATKVRFRPEIALTRLQLAELLLDGGADVTPALRGEPRRRGALVPKKTSPSPRRGEVRTEALGHLDFAIAEFREMKMQPSLERALRHKEVLKA